MAGYSTDVWENRKMNIPTIEGSEIIVDYEILEEKEYFRIPGSQSYCMPQIPKVKIWIEKVIFKTKNGESIIHDDEYWMLSHILKKEDFIIDFEHFVKERDNMGLFCSQQ